MSVNTTTYKPETPLDGLNTVPPGVELPNRYDALVVENEIGMVVLPLLCRSTLGNANEKLPPMPRMPRIRKTAADAEFGAIVVVVPLIIGLGVNVRCCCTVTCDHALLLLSSVANAARLHATAARIGGLITEVEREVLSEFLQLATTGAQRRLDVS